MWKRTYLESNSEKPKFFPNFFKITLNNILWGKIRLYKKENIAQMNDFKIESLKKNTENVEAPDLREKWISDRDDF